MRTAKRKLYFLVNKPVGILSTSQDPAGRPRVIDLAPSQQRLFTVGRLDKSSSGLILVTNDGELTDLLTHPRYGVEKTYLAQVAGVPTPESLAKWSVGYIWPRDMPMLKGLQCGTSHRHSTLVGNCAGRGTKSRSPPVTGTTRTQSFVANGELPWDRYVWAICSRAKRGHYVTTKLKSCMRRRGRSGKNRNVVRSGLRQKIDRVCLGIAQNMKLKKRPASKRLSIIRCQRTPTRMCRLTSMCWPVRVTSHKIKKQKLMALESILVRWDVEDGDRGSHRERLSAAIETQTIRCATAKRAGGLAARNARSLADTNKS